jgi:tetratricopeptide (TPR) repeat protein
VELLTKDQGPEWTRKSSSTRLAKRAEALLTKEVVALEGTDDIAMRVNAHVNRAAIRIWLHAPDSAAEDCEAAMAEDPSCSLAYAHLTNARILQDRAEDAVKVFEQAKNRGPNTPPLEGLAYGLLSLGKYSLAVEVTDKYGNLGEADHVDLGVALAAVESRISAGQLERAEQLLTKLFSEYKEHCRVSLVRAHLCERRGDFGAAMEALRMAETQVTEANERTLVNMQSAGFFSRRGTWDEAIRHYEAFIQSEVNDDLTKDYVRCLYNSSDRGRNIPRCRTICTAMRRRLGAVMPYAALEASIEENLGNVESALHIYSELLKTRPEDTAVKLRIAALQARLAKPQAAASILATIDLASIDRAESHVMIAQILSSADKDVEALDILFRAYRRFPNSRELNLAYMWLMTARGQRLTAKLAQASVDGDSGVEIVYDDEKRDYLLTTAPNPDPGLHEITSTTGLGVALLGHVEGDSFQFHDGLRECKVDVKAVFSKYVFIFRTIMGNFPVKFPDFPGFHRIPVNLQSPDPLKDLMPVFEALRRQTDSALKLYRVLPLFITTLSGLLAKDLIATCQILMGDEEGFLHCSEGTRNEQVYEDVVTNNATGAVVDGTALVTMTLLGMELDTSPKLKRLYVSQSLYDAIHVQCIRDHETMENQAAAHGTELPSPERVFSCQSFKLLEKTERSGRDLPRKMQGSEEEDDIDHMVEDSIDLCTRLKLPLWSDDYRLRAALRQRSGIPSFSTLAVLRSALFAGTLKPAEYGDALARLLLSNYRLIPLNGRILFHLFELTSYRLTPAVERCLRTLESPGISLSSLLGAIADSITSLWLIKLVPIERPQLVLRLRDVVARRDPRAESIRALSAMIEHRLRLYPQAVKEIHELLKPGPGGIILPG